MCRRLSARAQTPAALPPEPRADGCCCSCHPPATARPSRLLQVVSERLDHRYRSAVEAARTILAGYCRPLSAVLPCLLDCLDAPGLALLQWQQEFRCDNA